MGRKTASLNLPVWGAKCLAAHLRVEAIIPRMGRGQPATLPSNQAGEGKLHLLVILGARWQAALFPTLGQSIDESMEYGNPAILEVGRQDYCIPSILMFHQI